MWSVQEKRDRHVGTGTHAQGHVLCHSGRVDKHFMQAVAKHNLQLFELCVPLLCSACGSCTRNSTTAQHSMPQHGPPVPRHLRELEYCPAAILLTHSTPDFGIGLDLFSLAGTAYSRETCQEAGRHDRRSAGVCCLLASTQ